MAVCGFYTDFLQIVSVLTAKIVSLTVVKTCYRKTKTFDFSKKNRSSNGQPANKFHDICFDRSEQLENAKKTL